MLRNILKIAARKFLLEKTFTFINITGLSLGLCSCIAIFVIVRYEFSFDAFHAHRGQIYRVMMDVTEGTGDKSHFARSPVPLSGQARDKVSGLNAIGSIIPYDVKIKIIEGQTAAKEFDSHSGDSHFSTTVIAEPQWFSVFGYTFLAGDRNHILEAPYNTVLTESRARQYFGTIPLPSMIGKQVIYADSLVATVSGIVKDWPSTTDLGFTDFISAPSLVNGFLKRNINADSWNQRDMLAWTFVKINEGAKTSSINSQLVNLVNAASSESAKPSPWLQSLADMHFDADVIENVTRSAHRPTLYGLMIIAAFILTLAIINFINLSTVQALQRNKEAGIRKVMGSGRGPLVAQYFAETFLLTLIAVLFAACFVQPVLNAFHNFIPEGAQFSLLNSATLLFLCLITVVVTLLSAWYPAWVLSSAVPALVLRNAEQKGGNQWLLRKGLIVFQFTVSLVFITGVIVMKSQLNYIRSKDLGFNAGAIVMVNTPWGDSMSKLPILENNIKKLMGVSATALQWVPPLADNGRGRNIKFKRTDAKETGVVQIVGNEEFIPLYHIQLLAGRNLDTADTMKEIIINETLSKMMGYPQPKDVIGKPIYWSDVPYPIVGVVKDFHTRSLHEAISPLCFVHRKDREGTVAVKLGSSDVLPVLTEIERAWKEIYPGKNFSYAFYDETLAQLYQKDRQTAMLINVSMAITIFISCFGLFGLALFTAQKRAKEISIRKILGASVPGLAVMLCKDFIKLVFIGLLIATPIAWYFANEWLNNFAYRIHISPWMFILAGITAIFITLLTVGFQALKAALANPVKNLRSE
jgi:putative ABC transport system permease protein